MDNQQPRFIRIYEIFSGELLSGQQYKLLIPNYQRGYKWAVKNPYDVESESSVEYLLNNILAEYEHNSEYFLQGITVSIDEQDASVAIIDGQQRITTLYLILWYLDCSVLEKTEIEYASRTDTRDCLKKLKELKPEDVICNEVEIGNTEIQDIRFIRDAIGQIHTLLGSRKAEIPQILKYIQEKIKVIFIPIANPGGAVSTFTMMNGSKAIMRSEELIKAELLRMLSQSFQEFRFDATSMEEALERLRAFSALDWDTAQLRSRYAREWDKWLYWWNRSEVQRFYRIQPRPMGLLLEYFYRKENKDGFRSFREFKNFLNSAEHTGDGRNKSLSDIADSCLRELRKLQKKFEDVYADNYTYNMLSLALSVCKDDRRYEVISYFLDKINVEDYRLKIRRFTETLLIGGAIGQAMEFAESGSRTDELAKLYQEFKDVLLAQFLYGVGNEEAFRYLTYRNVLIANELKERFNISIMLDGNRSLEHIHPKSKVLHYDEERGIIADGNDSPYPDEESPAKEFPNPMPDGYTRRDDITYDEVRLSEHSICNLVLLYGKDNSRFGAKPFSSKKSILFNVRELKDINARSEDIFQTKEVKQILDSRTLQHTLSKFAVADWTPCDMANYYLETKNFLENQFLK